MLKTTAKRNNFYDPPSPPPGRARGVSRCEDAKNPPAALAGRRFAPTAAVRTQKEAPQNPWEAYQGEKIADPLCRAFQSRWRRHSGIGAQSRPRRNRLQESQLNLSLRPQRQLDQGKMPPGPRGRHRRLENDCRKIPLANGRRV